MVVWLGGLVLGVIKAAANVVFALELQRAVFGWVKPSTIKAVERAEQRILARVGCELDHVWVPVRGGHVIHTLVASGGEKGAQWQQQQQPVIVLLHGHSMSSAFFYRNFDHLVEMGFRVYAPDLLGWARSSRPPFEGHDPLASVDFFVNSLTDWADELGLGRFVLLGHSLGAYVAHTFASRNPERVLHLSLIAPAAIRRELALYRAFYFSITPQAAARRGGLLGYLLFLIKFPKLESYVRDRMRDYTWALASQPGEGSGDFAVRNMIRWKSPLAAECQLSLVETMRPLNIPVCLIGARNDALVPMAHVEELYTTYVAHQVACTLYTMDTDHCPHFEDPTLFAEILFAEVSTKVPSLALRRPFPPLVLDVQAQKLRLNSDDDEDDTFSDPSKFQIRRHSIQGRAEVQWTLL
ncbi:putative 1-acylglycerol-3-phosphate O-acyltransferase [Porphyridium purpureum]|uniref:Putative 1-acylglycerol-3-phosphate O-acyltransferase n=1 Tax=Porphyridium purpureum TaxID=35688 RepID=A0A5J4YLH0_PORPP|nr:putative 1-acylglycerol-3-phosphate O-acyltransferase [Porphyridium purpureum]|eukprot:POR8900..scf249_10